MQKEPARADSFLSENPSSHQILLAGLTIEAAAPFLVIAQDIAVGAGQGWAEGRGVCLY